MFWPSPLPIPSCYLLTGQRDKGSPQSPKNTNVIRKIPFSQPKHLPKDPPSNTISYGGQDLTYKFWGGNIQTIAPIFFIFIECCATDKKSSWLWLPSFFHLMITVTPGSWPCPQEARWRKSGRLPTGKVARRYRGKEYIMEVLKDLI